MIFGLEYSFFVRALLVVIISGFFPLAALTFLTTRIKKKKNEYEKVLKTFGISSKRDLSSVYGPGRYFLPLFFATLICVIGSVTLIFPQELFPGLLGDEITVDSILLSGGEYGLMDGDLQRQSLTVLVFAFLGSFIWSSKNVIVRIINYDLLPNVFYLAGLRILLACSIALVLSFILGAESNPAIGLTQSLPWIALATGMMPDRIFTYLVDRFKIIAQGENFNTRELALRNIEGMSLAHRERLEEEGIDNAQNLAEASLTQLIMKTPFEARQLLDWIGQAKLLVYAKDKMPYLRSVGIRSAYDFLTPDKDRRAMREITTSINLRTPLLEVLYEQFRDDVGVRALYNFRHRLNSNEDPPRNDIVEDPVNRDSSASFAYPPADPRLPERDRADGDDILGGFPTTGGSSNGSDDRPIEPPIDQPPIYVPDAEVPTEAPTYPPDDEIPAQPAPVIIPSRNDVEPVEGDDTVDEAEPVEDNRGSGPVI